MLVENLWVFNYLSGYMVTAVTVTVFSLSVNLFGSFKKV
jgi:hypothetical protein